MWCNLVIIYNIIIIIIIYITSRVPAFTSASRTLFYSVHQHKHYTSLSTLVKFKLTPYIQDANVLYSVQSAASSTCVMVHTRLQCLAIQAFNPVVKLVLENQPFLMPEPAEKPSLQFLAIQAFLISASVMYSGF